MAYKINGSVISIGELQTLSSAKTGNSYSKRDIVIAVRTFDQYTGEPTTNNDNTPKFTFIGDRCRDLDQIKVGDIVTIDFEVYGRSYVKDSKLEYFTDIRPFRINRQPTAAAPLQYPGQAYQQSVQDSYQNTTQTYGQQATQTATQPTQENNGDLPF